MSPWIGAILLASAVLLWPGMPRVSSRRSLRWRVREWVERRTRQAKGKGVVPFLDALAAAMGAGLSHANAISMAVESSPRLSGDPAWQSVIDDARTGKPLASSWARLARRSQDPDVAALARAWRVSERLGCPLAEAVRSCALDSRSRSELRGKVAAATAGTTATSNLLSMLPVGGVLMAWSMGFAPTALYGTPVGMSALAIGLTLILVGRVIVARLICTVTGRLT
ncbi:type II secretion system F family protein [Ornithinimicrobium sp. Arc0846-15]|nr:type II secretion system F family protein [Ornithinimicrobium laminariae]